MSCPRNIERVVARRPTGSIGSHAAKRAVDVLGAATAILAFAPLMTIVAAAILVRMGRPILFRQVRTGKDASPFTILKFRTMRATPEDDAHRLTGLGRLLRRTSLDELPQVWNVLRGEMSLVGPRPLLPEYLPLYTQRQARRHEALPGLTGWAQIRGRNASTWEKRMEDDLWYVENRSLALDLKIVVLTCFRVVEGRGVTDGGATQTPFLGASEGSP
jgi:lipopolysaccharide/colanic/teichoic acid biosynthesis glycosyltransferase